MSKQEIINALGGFVGLLILLFLAGFAVSTSRIMPDNAIMMINDQTQTYAAPFCVQTDQGFRVGRYSEIKGLDYKHQKCRDENIFLQRGRSFSGKVLEYIGVLKPLPKRWNDDGTWNW